MLIMAESVADQGWPSERTSEQQLPGGPRVF